MPNVVNNPTKGDVYIDETLTNFAQKWLQDQTMFVATRAFPNVPVTKQSSQYYVFDRGSFFRRQDSLERAPGTPPRQAGFSLSRENYNALVYGLRTLITDEDRGNQDAAVDLDTSSLDFVMQQMMIEREADFASTFMVDNVWFNGQASAQAGQDRDWTAATSEPINDMDRAKDLVHRVNGKRPNRAIFGRAAFTTFKNNEGVLDRISGGATTGDPAMVTMMRAAQLLELEEVLVMDGIENNAIEGAADSFDFIGGDNVLLYYAPATANIRTVTAGARFSWTGLFGATEDGLRTLSYRHPDPGVKADYVEAEMTYDHKASGPSLGFLFRDVTTTTTANMPSI